MRGGLIADGGPGGSERSSDHAHHPAGVDRRSARQNTCVMHVDTLIAGTTIVTMDAQRRVIADGAIAICGDRIAAVGKRADIDAGCTARATVDGRRFVATPGTMNGST